MKSHYSFNRRFVYFYFILIFPLLLQGDDFKKWGEVDPQYLNMTVYPEDTSAAAIKIFDEAVITLEIVSGVEMFFERHYQTKILKESGKEHADVAIPYWHKDKITAIDAQIISPDGNTIKIKGDQIFDEEAKKYYRVKKFTFPDVQVGSILEVRYRQRSTSVSELEPWYFHQSIPVIESEIALQLDPIVSYFVKTTNDPNHLVIAAEEQYHNRTRNHFETRYRYKAVNLSAIKNEPYISSLNNYRANINFQIKSITYQGFHQEYIKDLQTLCNTLLDEEYNTFNKPSSKVKNLTASLIAPSMNNNQKAEVLFEYVRDNFDSDRSTNIYVSKKQDEILEQKKCSDTEKNMLLKVMLEAAGFKALPVLISTRDHGLADPEIPFLSQYNKTILLVNFNNEYFLFDARDPWITYGQLPPSSLVDNAMLIQKDNASFLQIPNSELRSVEVIESQLALSSDGLLNSESEILAIGYASANYNKNLYDNKTMFDLLTDDLADGIEGFTVTESDSNLIAVPSDTFTTKFKFELENHAQIIDDEIYLKPGIFFTKNKNVFISEKRSFPVEFGYLWQTIETNYYTLPKEITLSELPKEIVIENDYFKYQRILVITKKNPLTIGFSRIFEVKDLVAPTEEYTRIRNDYSKIVDSDQEMVILKYIK